MKTKNQKIKCKHEWRQKIVWGVESPKHGGYYCIRCLEERGKEE